LIALQGLFDTSTPFPVIMVVLLAGGMLRSMFFTGCNALGYSDVDDEQASQATAIVAVSQQISVAFGVAVAGALLELTTHMRGGELALVDFQIAFVVVGLLSMLAAVVYYRLPADAGSNVVAGRKRATIDKD
jgi:hypothetical protein